MCEGVARTKHLRATKIVGIPSVCHYNNTIYLSNMYSLDILLNLLDKLDIKDWLLSTVELMCINFVKNFLDIIKKLTQT